MIIYEVNCAIDVTAESEFLEWLEGHVAQLVELDGFVSGTAFRVESDDRKESVGNQSTICISYQLKNQQALDRYLDVHAPAMRAEGVNRFRGKLDIYRRVLSSPLLEVHDRTIESF